jgi:putative inorganic carbon (HCO3(-)) transporter
MSTQDTSSSRLDLTAFVLLAAGLGLIQFDIRAEILLGLAGILWGVMTWRERTLPAVPAFFTPLVVLAAVTALSAAVAVHPLDSFLRLKQLLLYLIVPLTMRVARGRRAGTIVDTIIALGSAAAVIGVIQYVTTDAALVINNRPHGMLGHYMTYSGVLMLVVCAVVARLLFREREWVWPAVALPALLVALAATLSRNVWVGTAVAIGAILAARRRVLLLAIPVVLIVGSVIAPASVRTRAFSAFDPNDPSNRDRIAMLKAGVAMIKDHPVFGVGPNMVPQVYLQYRTADAVERAEATGPETRSHLHNVPMQIAAERGLIALGVFFWFVVVVARDLWRRMQQGPAPAVAAAGFAAVVAMLTAGLFEHNFGDSEFLILFLALISLPFAAEERDSA